jgi:hypothetical protein
MATDLRDRLRALGLLCTSQTLDDILALAAKKRWSAQKSSSTSAISRKKIA